MKYEIERKRYLLLCGNPGILKTADLLAARDWFSWRHCLRRLRLVPKEQRQVAIRLLRAAQDERRRPADRDIAAFWQSLERGKDMLKFFEAPLLPGVYRDRAQPVVLNGQRIGLTICAERTHGNKARVYYRSKEEKVLALTRVEVKQQSTGSAYLDVHGAKAHVTVYHVEHAKKTLLDLSSLK
jgi:hypothetical protein